MTASEEPATWEFKPLLDLVVIRSGQVDPRLPEYRDLPLIAPDHIVSGTGRLIKKESAAAQGAISGKYLVKPGDVIYSKIRPYLQKAYKCDFEALCSADMYPLTPRSGVDSSFILHTLLSRDFSIFATSVSARSGIPKINREELSEFELWVPPSDQQHAIGLAIDDIDALIIALEALLLKKRAIKRGLIQQLLSGKKRLQGFHQRWTEVRTGEIGSFRGGNGFAPRFQGSMSGSIPFYKVSDMNIRGNELFMKRANNYITDAQRKSMSATVFPPGAIVFAKVGAAVFLERKRILSTPSCIDNNLAAFLVDKARADVRYMHYFFTSFRMGSLVATGALPSLNGGQLRSIVLPLPAVEEQRAIATVLADCDAELDGLVARLTKAKDMKAGMMQQMLTTRRRSKELTV